MTRALLLIGSLTLLAQPVLAQSEEALRRAFEGKTVVVKIDMPATERGIDLYPRGQRILNFEDYSGRVKDHGIALRSGTPVMVTKVKVKDDLIEFQLGGGGSLFHINGG